MQETKIEFENFDFHHFVDSMFDFAPKVLSDPEYFVQWVKESKDEPNDLENCLDHNVLLKALEDGKCLFFSFSDVNFGEPIRCANGKAYLLLDDDYVNENDEDENDEDEYEIIVAEDYNDSDFCFGDVDCLGYLLEKKGDQLIINTAINAGGCCPGPGPSIDIKEDCYIFDQPMKEFIQGFIK